MTRFLWVWPACFLWVVMIAGCSDQDASERHAWQAQFSEATQDIELAQSDASLPLMQKQIAAIAAIKPLTQMGNTAQQAAGRRLLAEHYQTQAMHLAQLALSQGQLLEKQVGLMGDLQTSLQAVDQQAFLYGDDQLPLLNTLRDQKSQYGQIAQRHHQQIDQATALGAAMDQKRLRLASQASRLAKDASLLREQAFVAKGQAQYQLYRQALELQAKADQHHKQIQALNIKQEVAQSTLRIDQQQVQVLERSIQRLDTQIRQITADRSLAAQKRSELKTSRGQLESEFQEAFSQLQNQYRDQVGPPSDQAIDSATLAVQTLQGAKVQSAQKQGWQIQLLQARITQLKMFAQQIEMVGRFCLGVRNIAHLSTQLKLATWQAQTDKANQLVAQQAKLIEQVMPIAAQTVKLASELASGANEQTQALIALDQTTLDDLRQRVTQAIVQ